jgi:hypothetical protein
MALVGLGRQVPFPNEGYRERHPANGVRLPTQQLLPGDLYKLFDISHLGLKHTSQGILRTSGSQ